MKDSGVYVIENKITGLKYIGSSKQIKKRWAQHYLYLEKGIHNNTHLQNSYNKHGKNAFINKVILKCNTDDLLKYEQLEIDNSDFNNLYNKLTTASNYGSEVQRNSLYLLNLKGEILKKFKSGMDLAEYLDYKLLVYKHINTKSITKSKYRIVTPDFYKNSFDIIKSWNPYSCKTTYKYNFIKYRYIIDMDGNIVYGSKHRNKIAKYLNLTVERVRQIIKSGNIHKKSNCYIIEKIIDHNTY